MTHRDFPALPDIAALASNPEIEVIEFYQTGNFGDCLRFCYRWRKTYSYTYPPQGVVRPDEKRFAEDRSGCYDLFELIIPFVTKDELETLKDKVSVQHTMGLGELERRLSQPAKKTFSEKVGAVFAILRA